MTVAMYWFMYCVASRESSGSDEGSLNYAVSPRFRPRGAYTPATPFIEILQIVKNHIYG